MIDWLAPIDPTRPHEVSALLSWHGRAMVAAWAVLTPCGVLAARYFKVTPWQDWPRELDAKTWWNTHRATQYGAVVLTLLAFALVLLAPPNPARTPAAAWHRGFGFALLGLAGVQVLGAWLRGSKGGPTAPAPDGSWRGDHYDMTPRRLAFEAVHKTAGYAALAAGFVTAFLGLWQANGPLWMWATLAAWAACVFAAFAVLEARGGRVGTYAAIWGPQAKPGLRRGVAADGADGGGGRA